VKENKLSDDDIKELQKLIENLPKP